MRSSDGVKKEVVYLDHHSTTPCHPRVVARMLPYFSEIFGNPAAITHVVGRRAGSALEEARVSIADFLGVRPGEVYFTAGATEANNIVVSSFGKPGAHLITTAIEHKSVLAPFREMESRGTKVTVLQPDSEGFVSADQLRGAIRPETALISVIAASGDIGTIQPLDELAAVAHEHRIAFHSDATQAIGKIPMGPELHGCDLLGFSAHKFYGPKGIGCLVVKRGTRIAPLIRGGGQEKNLRSGTVNVPGVIGMAEALEVRREVMTGEFDRLTKLRNRFWDALITEIEGAVINGPRASRLPGNLNVSFGALDAEALIYSLRNFALSTGSACSSGEREPSSVLKAIGCDDVRAMSSIRFGLGDSTTVENIDLLVSDIKRAVAAARELTAPGPR
ncbi:MAG: cysteine desulfurase family protein [Acidobacteriota bacterium]